MESTSRSTDVWEETIAEFRELGGIAENVRLGNGPNGRGLFSIDPSRESRVWLPRELMFPTRYSLLAHGSLTIAPEAGSPRAVAFFNRYQERLGWACVQQGAYETQRLWHELPDAVQTAIAQSGALEYSYRFAPPTDDAALAEFIQTRTGRWDGEQSFIPVLELVNHHAGYPGYVVDAGVGVSGTFPGELFVRYNTFDPIACALVYSVAAPSALAMSTSITVDLPGGRVLSIKRRLGEGVARNGRRYPVITEHEHVVELSHLLLGHLTAPVLPRAIFREMMAPFVTRDAADSIFDGIAHFNRSRWIAFLRLLRKHHGPLITILEDAVIDQLEALSASVGGDLPA